MSGMDKVLYEGKLGSGGSIKVELKSGNPVVSVSYDTAELAGTVQMTVKSRAGLEKVKQIIPGTIDDVVIDIIIAALGV